MSLSDILMVNVEDLGPVLHASKSKKGPIMTDKRIKDSYTPHPHKKTAAQTRDAHISELLDTKQTQLEDKIATMRAVGAIDKARLGSALRTMMRNLSDD